MECIYSLEISIRLLIELNQIILKYLLEKSSSSSGLSFSTKYGGGLEISKRCDLSRSIHLSIVRISESVRKEIRLKQVITDIVP